MTTVTRHEGELLVAGVRVLSHLQGRSPTPEELAELLNMSSSAVRLQVAWLADLGAMTMVESAFEDHVEIADLQLLDSLATEDGPAISEDLRAFDQRKQEEAEKMSRLFSSGEMEARQKRKMEDMERGLGDFHKKKPRNPFGED